MGAHKSDDINKKYTANLDQALDVAGIGWYNLKYCLVIAMLLIASIMEMLSYSMVLPAAVCDLQMSDSERGFIVSVAYIGILLTSYPWGYLVDTRGRKNMLIISSLIAGGFSMLSALMPNLISYTICKFIASLCLACPSATPYTYIGEMLPAKNRDVLLSILNATQVAGSAFTPLLAWAILPLDFRVSFGIYVFRPWRLLTMTYAAFFIIVPLVLILAPESPKYLVSQNKHEEALKVLQNIYAGNKNKRPEEYPIQKLIAPVIEREKGSFLTSLKVQTVPLLSWSYFKWILLNGFLLFGTCSILNGLNIWAPEVINRVLLDGGGQGKTACEVIVDKQNQTAVDDIECNDTIDELIFIINTVARLGCAVVALIASSTVQYIGKKNLIIASFWTLGVACIAINFIRNDIVFATILSSTPIVVLSVGPVNAYAVEIFPTHLRGMAVNLTMMLGRIGSMVGANVTALMINNSCEGLFYLFGGLIIIAGVLALLLPNSKGSTRKQQDNSTGTE